jgi:hypothetical protein
VRDRLDGPFAVQFNGATLGFKVFDNPDRANRRDRRQQAAVGRVGAGGGAAGCLSGAAAARGAGQRPPNNLKVPGLPSKGREAIKCAAQPHCKDGARPLARVGFDAGARRVRRQKECHLYFARRVSSLS